MVNWARSQSGQKKKKKIKNTGASLGVVGMAVLGMGENGSSDLRQGEGPPAMANPQRQGVLDTPRLLCDRRGVAAKAEEDTDKGGVVY